MIILPASMGGMAAQSIYKSIIDQVVAGLNSLNLTYSPPAGGAPLAVNAVARKLPRAEESIDSLPAITVSASPSGDPAVPWSTEDQTLVKYGVDIVLINPGNRDFTDTNLDAYFRYREQERRLLSWGVSGASTVFFAEYRPMAPIDPNKVNQNYDYSGFTVVFWSVEPRTN